MGIGTPEQDRSEDAEEKKEGTWYAMIELVGWLVEPLFWIGRLIVAAVLAALHGCS